VAVYPDGIYPVTKRPTYKQIDEVVKKYKESISETERTELKKQLLQAFHQYFMKYTMLLKGRVNDINNHDTLSFLSLFLTGREKTRSNFVNIYKYAIRVCKGMQMEDIYNELVTLFLELLDKFRFYPKATYASFTRYITKYMRWGIKAWVMRTAKELWNDYSEIPAGIPTPNHLSSMQHPEDIDLTDLRELDLSWVLSPQHPLFAQLSIHERFLLFMKFKEDVTSYSLSKQLGCTAGKIDLQINKAIRKLRNVLKGDKNV